MSDLGKRMKEYEFCFQQKLPRRLDIIIRIDGRHFRNFTHGLAKPYDQVVVDAIDSAMLMLCSEVSGVKLGYCQSDEISIVLTNDDTMNTEPWFDNNLQKLVSITASIATAKFNQIFKSHPEATKKHKEKQLAMFDSRVFVLPRYEVENYFIWRQQDATRNAIQALGQAHFSHKELQGLNTSQIQELLFTEKSINFNDELIEYKRGRCAVREKLEVDDTIRHKWAIDRDIPVFTQDRNYILDKLSRRDE